MLKQILAIAGLISSDGVESIINVRSEVNHGRMRRVLAHGFSEKAVREQEPLIQEYVDLLMQSLHAAAVEGPQNIVSWYELVSFDVIGMRKSILDSSSIKIS